jgi:hypothetical protein
MSTKTKLKITNPLLDSFDSQPYSADSLVAITITLPGGGYG